MKMLTCEMTEEEREKALEAMFGGKVTYEIDYDKAMDDAKSLQCFKTDWVKEDMVAYLTQCIMRDFGIEDPNEALLQWEAYKDRHNIVIRS